MHQHGHYGAALLAYAPLGCVVLGLGFDTLALLGAVAAAALSMLPDVDQRVPGLTHRGPTHTVWFALGGAALLGVVGGLAGAQRGALAAVGLAAFGFGVGGASLGSHLLADALTPAGVEPFAPRHSRHYSYDLTTSANPVANYVLLALGVGASVAALALGQALAGLPAHF
jgi:inner membrane protein